MSSTKDELDAPLLSLDSPEPEDAPSSTNILPKPIIFESTVSPRQSDIFADVSLSNLPETSFSNLALSRAPVDFVSENTLNTNMLSAESLRSRTSEDTLRSPQGVTLLDQDDIVFSRPTSSQNPQLHPTEVSEGWSSDNIWSQEERKTPRQASSEEIVFSRPTGSRNLTQPPLDVTFRTRTSERIPRTTQSTSYLDEDEVAFEQPSTSTPRRLSLEESDDMEEVDLLSLETITGRRPGGTSKGASVLSSLSARLSERWNRPKSGTPKPGSMSETGLVGRTNEGVGFEMRSRVKETGSETRGVANLNPSFVLVDIPIEPTDTLPSFAIKYHVTTAELKRLNNLFADQDFYSRPSLKVPIHKYGILAERFLPNRAGYPSSYVLVDVDSAPSTSDNGQATPEDEVMHNVEFRPDSQTSQAKLFLQNMDRHLNRLTQEALARQTRPISPPGDPGPTSRHIRVEPLDGLGCDGADLGIPVKTIIVMALILTLVLPAVFLMYKLYCVHHPDACPDGMSVPVHNHTEPH